MTSGSKCENCDDGTLVGIAPEAYPRFLFPPDVDKANLRLIQRCDKCGHTIFHVFQCEECDTTPGYECHGEGEETSPPPETKH